MNNIASFVIPAKNEENTIGLCLDSISSQQTTNIDIEITVVDNNSSDNTISIAKAHRAKILTIENENISSLRNKGAQSSKGTYLCFVDADCILPNNWLSTCLDHLKNKEVCVVASSEWWYGDKPTWVERCWCKMKHRTNNNWQFVSWCSSQAMLIKREAFHEVNGFNQRLITCEDADLGYKLSEHCKIILDHTIRHQHIRGSKTLAELFRREKWRGKGNLQGIISHGIHLTELPSLLIPVLFGGSLCLFIGMLAVSSVTKNNLVWCLLIVSGIIFFSLPALMTIWKLTKDNLINFFIPCYVISFVYLSARFFSFFTNSYRNW